jgi:hypothetical protein
MEISDAALRVGRYRKVETNEEFLRALNGALAYEPPLGERPQRASLFITGAPRSGTTVMAQAVCSYFDVDYIDGLAAKFWRAPAIGLRLARMTFGEPGASDFVSDYGRASPRDVHSFHYFWMEQLRLGAVDDLFSDPSSRGVDWETIRAHVAALQGVSGKAFAFKGYYPSYFMEAFTRELPGSVFVCIRRDPLMEALSIHQARLAYHDDPKAWWSMQPPGVDRLLDLSPERQIAGQIHGLRSLFARQIGVMGEQAMAVTLDYEDLYTRPQAVFDEIVAAAARTAGEPLAARGSLPQMRPAKQPGQYDRALVARLESALAEYDWTGI